MTELPETYDPDSIERRWRRRWREMDVYSYDPADTATEQDASTGYVIDTPPPYPTGNLHIGNALGWCYMDFVARYQRLAGEEVLFPQGWDCHGLPTEVKVEERKGIHRSEVSREQFREWCIEHTESQIDEMRETMRRLGFSQDWDREFSTMDPAYWGETQRSFLRMAENGYVYQDDHPVNWCPRCETAIADAEVETEENVEGELQTVTFPGAGNPGIEIATTRPELLAACVAVAVHPDDERYADRGDDSFEVPLFGQTVELVADEAVDTGFGTGAVMICTFGDKQDVDWWAEYDLDLRPAVGTDGRLTEHADEFAGLALDEAGDEISAALDDEGFLNRTESTTQSVGQCWRCDTPIEILSTRQWFVEVREAEILETAREVSWVPEHMYERLAEWTEGMDWDWVVSRQRVFATPIPAWHCAGQQCSFTYLASEDELPARPTEDEPAIDSCPDCGATEWRGETDVMDTWMDSSISPLYLQGWPDEGFEPTALREQGHDIIRTWAFYTLLRTAALEATIPWEDALINGMVFGADGNKMSKSRDNFVQPEEVVEEQSADAFRQAMALGGQPGSDIQFQWKEVTAASRFQTKVWNVTRFATGQLPEDWEPPADPAYRDADRWIRARCARVADEVSRRMEAYRFDAALRRIREFVWEDLADEYLELSKGRLYDGRPGERDAARATLFEVVSATLRMLSPFAPFLTEEAYHALPGTAESVHAGRWPTFPEVDPDDEAAGELLVDAAATVRRFKSDAGLALNATLERVEVYPDEPPDGHVDTYDLSEVCNGPATICAGEPNVEQVPVDVEIDHEIVGPAFREQTGRVVDRLETMDPSEVQERKRDGDIELELGDDVVTVPGEAVEVVETRRAESGEDVAVQSGNLSTVLVYR